MFDLILKFAQRVGTIHAGLTPILAIMPSLYMNDVCELAIFNFKIADFVRVYRSLSDHRLDNLDQKMSITAMFVGHRPVF